MADSPDDKVFEHTLTVKLYSAEPLDHVQDLDALAAALTGGEVVSSVELQGPRQLASAALARVVAAGASTESHTGGSSSHTHTDEFGLIHRCYHQCRHWMSPGFLAGWWIANTITFPVEHVQWDHIWPFDYVGAWLDRTGHLQMWISYLWLLSFFASIIFGLRYAVLHKDN